MAARIFGIDFGTGSIKIYRKGEGIIYDEKSVIAIKGKNNVIAIGDEAFSMYGKSPETITVDMPLRNGVIASLSNMLALLNCIVLDLTRENGKVKGAEFVIATPFDITEVDKKAFYDLVDRSIAKPKRLRLVEKPVADAIGAGIDIENSQGALVVNLGADTTEISVISMGGIVLSRLLPLGGNRFDEAIMAAVRKEHDLVIGGKTAEQLKCRLVNFFEETGRICPAYGRELLTGLPRERIIKQQLVNDAVLSVLTEIIQQIRGMLERIPPEIAADVYANGMYITGGGAAMVGLERIFRDLTGLKVTICESGSRSVVEGLGTILENGTYLAMAKPLKAAE